MTNYVGGQHAEYTRQKMLECYDIEMREKEKQEKERKEKEHRSIADDDVSRFIFIAEV